MSGAIIDDVEVTAAHDGVAELKLTLRHANGGVSPITLDEIATGALMKACDTDNPAGLIGQSWEKVRDALNHSWNRYSKTS